MDEIYNDNVKKFHWKDKHPVVHASSCLTGRYVEGESIAEVFLKQGVAVYIGATEVSYGYYNLQNDKNLYKRWDTGESIGRVLRNVKEDTWFKWIVFQFFVVGILSFFFGWKSVPGIIFIAEIAFVILFLIYWGIEAMYLRTKPKVIKMINGIKKDWSVAVKNAERKKFER